VTERLARTASEIVIDTRLCKGCHICIEVCPQRVFEKADSVDDRGFFLPVVANLEACKVCHLCELECPDFAIKVVEDK